MEFRVNKPDVRVYGQHEDPAALRQFWYQTYVAEFGRDLDQADHDAEELPDPLTRVPGIIAATQDAEIVGTLVYLRAWRDALGDFEAMHDMRRLGSQHPGATGVITKLMIAPQCRNTELRLRLFLEFYRRAVPQGLHHAFIDCGEQVLPFLLTLGFLPWGPLIERPANGVVHVLKLDCLDTTYLKSIRSPLLQVVNSTASWPKSRH